MLQELSVARCCQAPIISDLSLTPGTRLGVYEVTAPLGEGGMGQVWRATDTTLGRQVAIKILPDAFAADPERLARFEREAKTLASLNHPHIAAIYAVEKSGGTLALVMELVEGEDLSQRVARGAIPLDEALPIWSGGAPTPRSAARSRSRSCRTRSPPTPSDWRGSSAKPRRWRRSIVATSRRSMPSRSPAAPWPS